MSTKSRDEDFIAWIRQQPCATCGMHGVYHEDRGEFLNDPSHIKTQGSGGKDKGNTIPQCRRCHSMLHNYGVVQFGKKIGRDLFSLARTYEVLYAVRNHYHTPSSASTEH